jgi:small subunit ribosomal protein S17
MAKKQLKGRVVSNKMSKTVVVSVGRMVESKKYKKRFMTQKRYKAHAENEKYSLGDSVLIEECSPFSKEKKWKVIKKLAESKLVELDEPAEIFAVEDIKEENIEQK